LSCPACGIPQRGFGMSVKIHTAAGMSIGGLACWAKAGGCLCAKEGFPGSGSCSVISTIARASAALRSRG
jgi:hypothetical protein